MLKSTESIYSNKKTAKIAVFKYYRQAGYKPALSTISEYLRFYQLPF
jgi:hypothetical protein